MKRNSRDPKTFVTILSLVWGLMWLLKSSRDLDTLCKEDSATFSRVFEKDNGNFLKVKL